MMVPHDHAEVELLRQAANISGDSGEAERIFRAVSERHSGMNPNTIGAYDAGISIVQEVFGFVKRNIRSKAKEGCR
jgi:hypothetical protein